MECHAPDSPKMGATSLTQNVSANIHITSHFPGVSMRTNIDLDAELVRGAQALSRIRTKRELWSCPVFVDDSSLGVQSADWQLLSK